MKKSTKKKGIEYEIKFWKDWLEADSIKRLKLVEKLPLFRMYVEMENKEQLKRSFSMLLNSYFEDLESAVYTKTISEKNNR